MRDLERMSIEELLDLSVDRNFQKTATNEEIAQVVQRLSASRSV